MGIGGRSNLAVLVIRFFEFKSLRSKNMVYLHKIKVVENLICNLEYARIFKI